MESLKLLLFQVFESRNFKRLNPFIWKPSADNLQETFSTKAERYVHNFLTFQISPALLRVLSLGFKLCFERSVGLELLTLVILD